MSNPIKPTIKTEIIPLLLIIISVVASFYFYANFPEQVPMHWNIAGQVDGWGSKTTGAIILPLVIIAMYVMFLLIPYLDPKKDRYEQFVKVYHIFKNYLIGFMVLVYLVTGLAGLGYDVPVGLIIPIGVGILFILIGNYMAKIKMNWFMGIRTPWTLSSEEVWNKTHRMGGKIFMLGGFLIILTGIAPLSWRLPIFILTMVLLIFGTIGYSYWVYRIEKNKKVG
ncbi:MAG: SdpI family protein [Candidatus Parcubacteria bacterium]|nr:SdpI family protein [Candidatus Parcubacteria bacterium]